MLGPVICVEDFPWLGFTPIHNTQLKGLQGLFRIHTIHVWYIYLHLAVFNGKNVVNVGKYTMHGWYRYGMIIW